MSHLPIPSICDDGAVLMIHEGIWSEGDIKDRSLLGVTP